MGLAASQARFLAVTSRKTNCEFRSTELAQQKLSLTREMDYIAQEYNDSLNATKFVWCADGSDAYKYDLSYDIMMKPSDYNQYTPYLLSRQDGKIAFDDKMMKAVKEVFNYDENTGTCDGGIIYKGLVLYKGDEGYEDAKLEAFGKFIDGLKANNAIQGSVAEKMKDNGSYVYIPDAGVGGELLGKEKSNMMTANGLISYIDYLTDNLLSGAFEVDSKGYQYANNLIFDFEEKKCIVSTQEIINKGYSGKNVGDKLYDLTGALKHGWEASNGITCLTINGNYANDSDFSITTRKDNNNKSITNKYNGYNEASYSVSSFTMADLLNENVSLLVTGKQSFNQLSELLTYAITNTQNGANDIITSDVNQWFDKYVTILRSQSDSNFSYKDYNDLCKKAKDHQSEPNSTEAKDQQAASTLALLNFFDKLCKGMYSLLMPGALETGNQQTTEQQNAFILAMTNTISRFSTASSKYTDLGGKGDSEMNGKTAVSDSQKYNGWVKYGNEWAISLSNLTEAFLTDFANGLDNFQDSCLITKNVKSSTYITDYPDHYYEVNMLNDSQTGLWESEFYSVIFNNICNNGCYQNENLNDIEYLTNALKNSQLFVMSKANDNHYYQSKYTDVSGGHFVAEKDNNKIEYAEREYTIKKNQINYKEEKIEIEAKQIEAELSELTTELDSIKNLIKTSIDKTFKMFQS